MTTNQLIAGWWGYVSQHKTSRGCADGIPLKSALARSQCIGWRSVLSIQVQLYVCVKPRNLWQGMVACCEAYVDHMQKEILFGNCLAPVVPAHCNHHGITISVPRILILHTMPAP